MVLKLTKIDSLSLSEYYYLEDRDKCYFLGEYISGGVGWKGGKTNSLISNLKKERDKISKPEWIYKLKAIDEIAEAFKESSIVEELQTFTLVPIPPSKVKADPFYDNRILPVLEKLNKKLNKHLDIRELIQQRRSTEADHATESRQALLSLIENYYIDERFTKPKPKKVFLFDDVLTSGKHFAAAKEVLEEEYPEIEIFGVFVARTIHSNKE